METGEAAAEEAFPLLARCGRTAVRRPCAAADAASARFPAAPFEGALWDGLTTPIEGAPARRVGVTNPAGGALGTGGGTTTPAGLASARRWGVSRPATVAPTGREDMTGPAAVASDRLAGATVPAADALGGREGKTSAATGPTWRGGAIAPAPGAGGRARLRRGGSTSPCAPATGVTRAESGGRAALTPGEEGGGTRSEDNSVAWLGVAHRSCACPPGIAARTAAAFASPSSWGSG